MIKRLRVKFVCTNMILVMTMLAVILCLLYRFTADNLEQSSISSLQYAMDTQGKPGRPGASAVRLSFVIQEQMDGSLLVIGGSSFDLSDETMVADIYRQAEENDGEVGVLTSYSLRFYREEGLLGDRYAFIDISSEQTALRSLMRTCVLIGVCGFAGFLVISILLARWAIHPVEKAWEQQRQFVADASHELKTPLTVILTNAELLQADNYGQEEKQQFSDSILQTARQRRGLVEDLLQLARGDRGQQKAEMEELDISELTENALLPFEPLYFEQGLMLESQIQPGLKVKGDAVSLRQTVNILLDNGQKYSAPGGTASLQLSRQGKKILLRFFTPGEPLTQEQCQDIFKRFFRLDEARTSSGSYGLGLSIAQNIVDSHGGRIWAEGCGEGNVFCVTLPEA